jgi:hypothetical protein
MPAEKYENPWATRLSLNSFIYQRLTQFPCFLFLILMSSPKKLTLNNVREYRTVTVMTDMDYKESRQNRRTCCPCRWGETTSPNYSHQRAQVHSPRDMMSRWNDTDRGKPKNSERKPVPVWLRPPQIPHALIRARTRASALRCRRLTAWAIARPCRAPYLLSHCVVSMTKTTRETG